MSAIVVAMAILMVAAEPPGQACVKSNLPLGMAIRECIESKARRLEPSGESAGDVATAAVSACRQPKHTYLAAVASCGKSGIVTSLEAELDRVGRERAIEIVVEIRARRHSRAK